MQVFKTCIILGLTAPPGPGEVSKLEVNGCKDQQEILEDKTKDKTQTEKEIRKKLLNLLSGGKPQKFAMMKRTVLKAYDQLTKDGNGFVTNKEKARAGKRLEKMWPEFSFPAVPVIRKDSSTRTPPQTPTGSGSSSSSSSSSSSNASTSSSSSSSRATENITTPANVNPFLDEEDDFGMEEDEQLDSSTMDAANPDYVDGINGNGGGGNMKKAQKVFKPQQQSEPIDINKTDEQNLNDCNKVLFPFSSSSSSSSSSGSSSSSSSSSSSCSRKRISTGDSTTDEPKRRKAGQGSDHGLFVLDSFDFNDDVGGDSDDDTLEAAMEFINEVSCEWIKFFLEHKKEE